jgi:RNA polymerase sigma-70 factor, ECF subfamily
MGPPMPAAKDRFEALFLAHYRAVHRYALRRTDPQQAEEIVNETFMVCWRRLDRVPDPALPWLYAVAGNILANRHRASIRRDRTAARLRAQPHVADGRDPAERLAERDAILRAFVTLGERDREALRLVAWEGLSLADGARAAGMSRAAFAMRVHRARRRLAASLEAPGLHPEPALQEAS